jgi:uncharacterized Zn finger protein
MRHYDEWPAYVSVAQRKAKSKKLIKKLSKTIKNIKPVEIEGRKIASTFWGQAWCTHLEKFSDYSNRLPRGTSYVRHGAVCHLEIAEGEITAKVSGSSLYDVRINIEPLKNRVWQEIRSRCAGQIGSLIELLQGRISKDVMAVVTEKSMGLLPQPGEIKFSCDCPDWADMCKHVAAVLYGIGNRLDYEPELLFTLRGVDPTELIDESLEVKLPKNSVADESEISDDALQGMFGDDIDLQLDDEISSAAEANTLYKSTTKDEDDELYLSGVAVSARRESLGLTVAEFAELIGVASATIYRWERASKPFKIKKRYSGFFQKSQV